MECVKKCAFKKFSQEPAGISSCIVQGGVLIFKSTPQGLSDSMPDQVRWWWIQQLQSLHPIMPWRGKKWLPRELSSYLLGMMKGEKVTCPVFCLISDDLIPLQPIRCNVIHIHFPRHSFMPVCLFSFCSQRGHHPQHHHNHRA